MDTSLAKNEKPIVEFRTNGFIENPQSSIAMATVGGMALMFVTIMIGAPIFVSMVGLIGGICLVYGYKVGKVTYMLYSDGITLLTRRFIPYWISKKEGRKSFVWKEVKSFKHDFDKTRTGQEYEYIKLFLKKSPGQIWITNQRDKSGFETFRDTFLQLVAIERSSRDASPSKVPGAKRIGTEEVKTPEPYLVQKPSFCKTRMAKLLTILFVFVAILLILINMNQGLSTRNLFRLEVIIVPGIVYMIYRVYVKED
jgi:hypothetical protein